MTRKRAEEAQAPYRVSVMAQIPSKSTKPELIVRAALRRLGVGYRVNVKSLPGSPDAANKKRRFAVFVHGCFWHLHEGCRLARPPKRNTEYWGPKLRRNIERDATNVAELERRGFRVLVVWECETADPAAVERKLAAFLSAAPASV